MAFKVVVFFTVVSSALAWGECPEETPEDKHHPNLFDYTRIDYNGEVACYRVRNNLPQAKQVELGCTDEEGSVTTFEELAYIRGYFANGGLNYAWTDAVKAGHYYRYPGGEKDLTSYPKQADAGKLKYQYGGCVEWEYNTDKKEAFLQVVTCKQGCPFVCRLPVCEEGYEPVKGVCQKIPEPDKCAPEYFSQCVMECLMQRAETTTPADLTHLWEGQAEEEGSNTEDETSGSEESSEESEGGSGRLSWYYRWLQANRGRGSRGSSGSSGSRGSWGSSGSRTSTGSRGTYHRSW